ncbi:hypothetical protein TNCT_377781 [Trichonephila clavata]|uniref:Uncharacterized protein n=1 Tax=Trichonephila clavata TaxID=2740835 RepID=A0A8X6KFN4_TRICU|nr:hypothetical protein TNCT_448381 [Trichonephila clavata]GFQ89748.1 hypothetical protein TNCT_377781 [Trichonephila clavata]
MEEGGVNNAENDSMEEGRVNNSGENDSMEEGGVNNVEHVMDKDARPTPFETSVTLLPSTLVPRLGSVSPSSLFDGFSPPPGFAQNLDSEFQKCHFGRAALCRAYFGSRQCAIIGFHQFGEHFTQNQRSQNTVRILCHGRLPGRGSQEIYRPVSLRCRRGAWQTRPSRTSVVSFWARADPQECRSILESIFDGTCPECRDGYVESVQEQVAEIAEWRREQQTKQKRPMETKEESVKKCAH